jgi:hypothetical protein
VPSEVTAYPSDGNTTLEPGEGFLPIQSLASLNQSLALIYVTFKGAYAEPSDDIWWPAHQPGSIYHTTLRGDANITKPTYTWDNKVNVLACAEQHQFCNPNRGEHEVKCTPLTSPNNLVAAFQGLNDTGYFEAIIDNDRQVHTAEVIMGAAAEAGLDILLPTFTNPPLLDSDQHTTTVSPGLADDNWIQESSHLFNLTLGTLQRYMVEWATGLPEPYTSYTYSPTTDPLGMWQCDNQIVRRSGYTSFSSLGLGIILGVGGIIILFSLWIESIVGYFRKHSRIGLYRQIRWKLDSTLQLQRMAYEEAGLGSWKGGSHQVPVTVARDQKLEVDMEWDEMHPRLKGRATGGLDMANGSEMRLIDAKNNGGLFVEESCNVLSSGE